MENVSLMLMVSMIMMCFVWLFIPLFWKHSEYQLRQKHLNVCFSVWQQIQSIKYIIVNIKSSCQIVTNIKSLFSLFKRIDLKLHLNEFSFSTWVS